MVEEPIIGLENSRTCIRESSKVEKDMEKVPFGGAMGAGTRDSSDKVFKVVMVAFIATVV